MTTPKTCEATFTIDGQSGHQIVSSSEPIILQALDTDAASYTWSVTSSPAEAAFILTGAGEPQAQLNLSEVGSFVIQLVVEHGTCRDCARQIVWLPTERREYRLPASGEPLRFDGDMAWDGDLARVIQDVDTYLLTAEQKAAVDAANNPNAQNPFATQADMAQSELTPEQKAALDYASNPGADNPFVTRSILPIIPLPQLSSDEEAAVHYASNPGAGNPFITKNELPVIPESQLTPEQEAAIDGADQPGAENPFVTRSQLPVIPAPQLTPEQEAAIDQADHPGAENPFVTKSILPVISPPQLSSDEEAAVHQAKSPSADNPFITYSSLPVIPEPQLTPEQRSGD